MAMQSRQLLNAFSSLMMRFCSLEWPYCCAQLPIDFSSLCDISMRSDNLVERDLESSHTVIYFVKNSLQIIIDYYYVALCITKYGG